MNQATVLLASILSLVTACAAEARSVNPKQMGPVVNPIIRYNHGSFDWPDKAESMELRSKLVPVAP